jgi:uncharacterized Fe-S cluster protein YjdI
MAGDPIPLHGGLRDRLTPSFPLRPRVPHATLQGMRDGFTKKYSNSDVTVVWKPSLCQHTGICFMGLPQVFDPSKRPWIAIDGASTEEIIAQVKACPSGALSHYRHGETDPAPGE